MNTLSLLAQESSGNPLGLIILLLPIAAIIFLTVVPQRRQKQKQAQLMSSLAVGDEVVSIGGIHGVVNHIEDDVVHLEVDDDVVIKLGLGAVSRKADEPEGGSRSGGGFMSALMGGGATAQRSRSDEGESSDDSAGDPTGDPTGDKDS